MIIDFVRLCLSVIDASRLFPWTYKYKYTVNCIFVLVKRGYCHVHLFGRNPDRPMLFKVSLKNFIRA